MGLDFSHTNAHWAYGRFARFREALAQHEGIDLSVMDGFRRYGDDRPRQSWNDVTTPLKPLLNHSDCDGELTPEECREVAPRLREVVKAIWPDPDTHAHINGLALADGMDAAAKANEPLEFC